jgi:hypothetical protein
LAALMRLQNHIAVECPEATTPEMCARLRRAFATFEDLRASRNVQMELDEGTTSDTLEHNFIVAQTFALLSFVTRLEKITSDSVRSAVSDLRQELDRLYEFFFHEPRSSRC